MKHLKAKHKSEHDEFSASCSMQQPTSQQTLARWEKMLSDNPRAVKITAALTQYIVLDDQPLSVIHNVGFQWLFNILEPNYDIPRHYHVTDLVKKHIMSLFHGIPAVSFTTDIWTSSVCPMSLISLTVQWIDGDFTIKQTAKQSTSKAVSWLTYRPGNSKCIWGNDWNLVHSKKFCTCCTLW